MATKGKFPQFLDADVVIVLSEKPEDTLKLHIATLAKDSDFFRASLDTLEWSHNKAIIAETDGQTSRQMKLLELEFDGSEVFPTLVGRVSHQKRKDAGQQYQLTHKHRESRHQQRTSDGNAKTTTPISRSS